MSVIDINLQTKESIIALKNKTTITNKRIYIIKKVIFFFITENLF